MGKLNIRCGCGSHAVLKELDDGSHTVFCPKCSVQASGRSGLEATRKFQMISDMFYGSSSAADHRQTSTAKLACKVKMVIWNAPATIVMFEDGSKTVVKCTRCPKGTCKSNRGGELCDCNPKEYPATTARWKRDGLVHALLKHVYGSSYLDVLERWEDQDYKRQLEERVASLCGGSDE